MTLGNNAGFVPVSRHTSSRVFGAYLAARRRNMLFLYLSLPLLFSLFIVPSSQSCCMALKEASKPANECRTYSLSAIKMHAYPSEYNSDFIDCSKTGVTGNT